PRAASTITPEPSDSLIRSWVSSGNIRRKNGSLPNGLTRTRCLVCTLTTAGSTRLSIGARVGTGWPSTADGSAAAAGTDTAGGAAGAAFAGCSRASRTAVAAKPPNAAARDRASRVRVEALIETPVFHSRWGQESVGAPRSIDTEAWGARAQRERDARGPRRIHGGARVPD